MKPPGNKNVCINEEDAVFNYDRNYRTSLPSRHRTRHDGIHTGHRKLMEAYSEEETVRFANIGIYIFEPSMQMLAPDRNRPHHAAG